MTRSVWLCILAMVVTLAVSPTSSAQDSPIADPPVNSAASENEINAASDVDPLAEPAGEPGSNDTAGANEAMADSDSADAESVSNDPSAPNTDKSDKSESDANEPKGEENAGEEPAAATNPLAVLPDRLPDGSRLRPIALFHSQLTELVPDNFQPISVLRLKEAIDLASSLVPDDNASRLRHALYVIELDGNTLVSERSVLDIQCDDKGIVRRRLGRVNLAIHSTARNGNVNNTSAIPRLESLPDGDLMAVVDGDTSLAFSWSLKSSTQGLVKQFDLRLPASPQTRIILQVPKGIAVDSLDGVVRLSPSPPPELELSARGVDSRYYIIDAGGLSRVRLITTREGSRENPRDLLVRNQYTQYAIDTSRVVWTHQAILQLHVPDRLPSMIVGDSAITSIAINAVETPFSTTEIADGVNRIDISPPSGSLPLSDNPTSITIKGQSVWQESDGWCDLPQPHFLVKGIVVSEVISKVDLTMSNPLRVIQWQLPDGWTMSTETPDDEENLQISASGPPFTLDESVIKHFASSGESAAVTSDDRDDAESSSPELADGLPAWSKVRIAKASPLRDSSTVMNLSLADGLITATTRMRVRMDPQRVEPIRIELQRGWSLQSITLVGSGRVIETPAINAATSQFTIWPEASDVFDSELQIQATGQSRIIQADPQIIVPRSWFLRFVDVQGEFIAAVTPPANLDWSSQMSLLSQRIKRSDIDQPFRDFIEPANKNAMYLRCPTGRTPTLVLQPPSVAFDVSTAMAIRLIGDEVLEDLVIEMSTTNPSPQTITVQTGPNHDRPALSWSLRQSDGGSAISLPASNVLLERPDSDGVYTIDVSQWNLRGKRLVGRRRYPLAGDMSIRLPVIPNATSQTSEVLIGDGMIVKQSDDSVLRVPIDANFRLDELIDGRRSSEDSPSANSEDAAEGPAKPATSSPDVPSVATNPANAIKTRLRYDAVDQPSLTIAKTQANPNINIVWNQDVTLVASSHGTDRVEAILRVTASKPLRIDYDSDLQLVSVEQNGVAMSSIDLTSRPVVIQPVQPIKSQQLRLIWSRQQVYRTWWRKCTMPSIDVDAVVMQAESHVRASSDSFLPKILLAETPEMKPQSTLSLDAGSEILLVRRNNALAIGWLAAMLVFAFCWMTARRSLYLNLMIVLLMAMMAGWWWPWHWITIGWFLIPAIMGALLVSTLRWKAFTEFRSERRRQLEELELESQRSQEQATEFSVTTPSVIALAALLSLACAVASAQETGASATDTKSTASNSPMVPSVDLLVPVDKDGNLVGDKLYIPRELKSSLLALSSRSQPEEARFQSASYRLRVESDEDSLRPGALLLDADYIIHTDRATDRIILPFAPETIRRIELVQDEQDRIVQFVEAAADEVVASVPLGDRFRLRVTLIPDWMASENKGQLTVSLPPVSSSRLTVEGSGTLDRVRILGTTGQLISQRQLQIWTAELGPISKLAIEIEFTKGTATTSSLPLRRRYWLHAGKSHTTVECQVEPTYAVSAGDTVSLLIRDSLMPTVVSTSWEIRQTDSLSPTRRQVTMAALLDSPGPIQLLWTLPSRISQADSFEDAVSMVIPDVVPTTSGDSEPAWVGINSDPGIRVLPVTREPLDALTDDQFLAVWSGYRGSKPDRTFVAFGQLPSFQLISIPSRRSTISQTHQVHIAVDALEIRYQAEIVHQGKSSQRWILKLPAGVSLRQLNIDGQPSDARPLVSKSFTEVMLGDLSNQTTSVVDVIAVSNLPSNGRFTLPRLTLSPSSETTDRYFITRDQSLDVRIATRPPKEFVERNTTGDLAHLAKGWVPVAGYEFDSSVVGDAMKIPSMVLRTSVRPTRFDANQLITLSWSEGRWSMQSLTRFGPGKLPDFIDIQVPTRWCESLDVSSAARWSRQPANDVSNQLIRVSCDEQVRKSRVISIQGTLASSDKSRVSVPSIQILGEGKRTVHVSVPSRLTNEPIRWRSSSVRAAELPPFWVAITQQKELELSGPRATYAVAASGWSIELAPLQQQNRIAKVIAADTRVFPGHQRIVVMTRFDLVPGSLDWVDVALPEGATCLGAWTANQAVTPTMVSEQNDKPIGESAAEKTDGNQTGKAVGNKDDSPSDPRHVIRLPLSLSRLAQSVEVMFDVPLSHARRGDYAATILGIPVNEAWVSTYAQSGDHEADPPALIETLVNHDGEQQVLTPEQVRAVMVQRRGLSLAASIVQMINDSSDILAERPTAESTTWIRPMIARYEDLATEAGFPVEWISPATSDDNEKEGASEEAGSAKLKVASLPKTSDQQSFLADEVIPGLASWEKLNAEMLVHVKRYSSGSIEIPFLFSNRANLKGYRLQQIQRVGDQAVLSPFVPADPNETYLKAIITNTISLLAAIAILILLWPLKPYFNTVVSYPAFWLCLVAICGFFVAPIPVAASLLLVAISAPALPHKPFGRRMMR
ncbi:hypothetical protein [Novipirellula caenicola]|uniref:Uncharacterized protein n=1 Tax=Novipirellula caenicola TaxID=1536901 RepID=A0ABP9VTR5_9BACT